MKLRSIAWVAVPAAIGGAVYGLRTGAFERQWAIMTQSAPVAEYPERIDLGEREVGDQVTARFTIANRGGGVLTVEEIRANCSCSALEREVDGRLTPVDSLRLAPGSAADVQVRLAVRARPGTS